VTFLALLKSHCLAHVRIILGIKVVKSSEANNHVVRNLQSAFNLIGKTSRTKDFNVARCVLSESIVDKSTRQRRLLSHTCKIFKVDRKTLQKYSAIREKLETPGQKDCWAFVGRLPRSDMKLIDAVKELVQKFWHDNTRPSSNQRDVLKLRKGVRGGEPHVKHFLDTTQTELYERFKNEHTQLNLGQRSFEKCKPWYVRICIDRNTCCCRYHVEFEYYYDTYRHIFCGLHTNIVQDFPLLQPSNASREFIHSIMCPRPEGQKYYKRSCLYGTCLRCSGFALLRC